VRAEQIAALRLEAANAGIRETGKYVEWLEHELLRTRDHRDTLSRSLTSERDRRRQAESGKRDYD